MRPRQGAVDLFESLSLTLQPDEEGCVAEVDAAADDHVTPLGLVVGAPEATRSRGVIVGAELAGVREIHHVRVRAKRQRDRAQGPRRALPRRSRPNADAYRPRPVP